VSCAGANININININIKLPLAVTVKVIQIHNVHLIHFSPKLHLTRVRTVKPLTRWYKNRDKINAIAFSQVSFIKRKLNCFSLLVNGNVYDLIKLGTFEVFLHRAPQD